MARAVDVAHNGEETVSLFERILLALILLVLPCIFWWAFRVQRELHQISGMLAQLVQRQASPGDGGNTAEKIAVLDSFTGPSFGTFLIPISGLLLVPFLLRMIFWLLPDAVPVEVPGWSFVTLVGCMMIGCLTCAWIIHITQRHSLRHRRFQQAIAGLQEGDRKQSTLIAVALQQSETPFRKELLQK